MDLLLHMDLLLGMDFMLGTDSMDLMHMHGFLTVCHLLFRVMTKCLAQFLFPPKTSDAWVQLHRRPLGSSFTLQPTRRGNTIQDQGLGYLYQQEDIVDMTKIRGKEESVKGTR